jgi:hypothetical protein
LTKDISVKEVNEPTLIIHETAPSVCVTKLDSQACPYPYENDPPQFASLLKNPFESSDIVPDGTVDDDDVNSEDVGVDAETGEDLKDLEEMEIVEFEGKRRAEPPQHRPDTQPHLRGGHPARRLGLSQRVRPGDIHAI